MLSDEQLAQISDPTSLTTQKDVIRENLKQIYSKDNNMEKKSFAIGMLRMFWPKQIDTVMKYGLENANALDFDLDKIESRLNKKNAFQNQIPLIKCLHQAFEKGGKHTGAEIESILQSGIDQLKLTLKPSVKLLRNYVKLSERCNIRPESDGKKVKGYKILDFLQDI